MILDAFPHFFNISYWCWCFLSLFPPYFQNFCQGFFLTLRFSFNFKPSLADGRSFSNGKRAYLSSMSNETGLNFHPFKTVWALPRAAFKFADSCVFQLSFCSLWFSHGLLNPGGFDMNYEWLHLKMKKHFLPGDPKVVDLKSVTWRVVHCNPPLQPIFGVSKWTIDFL